jgi:hypothetical protein
VSAFLSPPHPSAIAANAQSKIHRIAHLLT